MVLDLNTDSGVTVNKGKRGNLEPRSGTRPFRASKARAWDLGLLSSSIGCLLKHFMGQNYGCCSKETVLFACLVRDNFHVVWRMLK